MSSVAKLSLSSNTAKAGLPEVTGVGWSGIIFFGGGDSSPQRIRLSTLTSIEVMASAILVTECSVTD